MLSCLGMQQELLRTPVTKPCDWGDVSVFKKYINSIWDLYRWRLQKCTSVTTFLSSETTCQATSDKEESSDKLTLWQFIFFFIKCLIAFWRKEWLVCENRCTIPTHCPLDHLRHVPPCPCSFVILGPSLGQAKSMPTENLLQDGYVTLSLRLQGSV